MSYNHGTGILTDDDLLFMTWGRTHFEGRPFHVMKYYPDPEGGRQWRGRRYSKVKPPLYAYDEMIERVTAVDDSYVRQSSMLDRRVIELPDEKTTTVFDPKTRAAEIRGDPTDAVERQFADTYEFFERKLTEWGLDIEIGVTASLLFGIHDETSDVDVIFYGEPDEMCRFQDRLAELLVDGTLTPELSTFEAEVVAETLGRSVDERLLETLASEKRYLSSFHRGDEETETHLLFLDDTVETIADGDAVGRTTVRGTARTTHEAKYTVPDFRVRAEDRTYRVLCYHKSGALVRDGDTVTVSGQLVETPDGPVVVQLDETADELQIDYE